MASVNRWESVGWTFWSISFLLALPGCIYLVQSRSYSTVSVFGYIVFGCMLAGAAASAITWVTNSILGVFARHNEKKEKLKKKSAQKKKKNKAK